ncbi:structural maintenance of chromosomes protein 5-like [Chenopodium quinoa]|uniref:structural maintenance of chromosomes protein 5-like n=1 Tax=Chenopodium quinoa TaxID=63459 RepID=UPI000B79395C|nr:structural maintenance of chromosomes protein 5-like [Chenopodium quinoa]
MSERRAKRPKIVRGEDDYLPGNITKIELHNFMTFEDVTCTPYSRLNLVIGPNGSGKSSIVCAIALGLGGDPQLLGRAGSVGAYVKRGEESGYIKITLRGESREERIVITRKIDTSNKSEWLLNGNMAAKKDVIEVVQKFNIQVNNLTQFLPQDKVCEFAKLSPVDLLRATENAIGDPQLAMQHDALIEKSSQLGRLQRAVDGNKVTLNQLKAQHAEQERDVERVRQRQDLLAQVDLLKKKLPWLKYDLNKAEYLEAKKQVDDANKKYDEAAKILNDLQQPIKKQQEEKALQDSKWKKLENISSKKAQRCKKLQENEIQWGVRVSGMYKGMEKLKRDEESRQLRMSEAKEELAAAELELANLPPYKLPKDEFERLEAKIVEFEDSAREIRQQKTDTDKILSGHKQKRAQLVDRLKDMENRNYKLLNQLKNSGADRIYEAHRWLQEHRDQLKREVYGPVLLEVTVKDQSHADYLEGQVPYYIWKSFITQDPSDRDVLVKHMKSFDVPILNYVPTEGRSRDPSRISEEMRKLGIHARLDQIFDAPAAVKEVLISQSNLDNSYIGTVETDRRADEVEKLKIMDFWTPLNHYIWSRSRYSDYVSASVMPVSRSKLLSCGSDNSEILSLRSKIIELEQTINEYDSQSKSLQFELSQIENEASKYYKQREEVTERVNIEKRRRKSLENRISQKRCILNNIEKEGDIDSQIANLSDQAVNLNIQRFHNAMEIKNSLMEALLHKWSLAEIRLSAFEIDVKIQESEMEIKHQERSAVEASMHLQQCKKEVERHKERLTDAKKYAESIAKITPEIKEAFVKMPSTIEELEAAIQDNLDQASSILLLNQNVLAEYEMRQRKIEALERTLKEEEHGFRTLLAEIDALKASWLPTLQNLVSQINGTFGHNFQEMAVAGEVSLDERDMDFGAYGIVIKVKFRQAGQLQVLSAHHQSGGERSVSTILYLVSLQDLTICPFRVVDEINQGMDPINERKMFQQLVRAASQPNTPQCFLLTPKLLPDLEYSDACSVLNIMNGPYIEGPAKVWSKGESWRTIISHLGQAQC